jgi:hypothetical protein
LTQVRENEEVLHMNEPQVWTLIGVFAAGLFGMLTLMSTMFVQVVRAEIRRLDQRFDTLDRDVQAIAKRVFGDQG